MRNSMDLNVRIDLLIINTFHSFGCPVYVLNEKQQSSKGEPKWLPRSRVGVYLGKSREHANSVSYVLNLKTDNISPQYHCVYDDDFTTVNAAKDADKIKLWSGLYTAQPNERSIINNLDKNKITFECESPQLNVIDVAWNKPSSGVSNLVGKAQTSTTPRALRQLNRENRHSLCSAQNTNTTSCAEDKCKSKRLMTTAHTNSVEGRLNSNKISQNIIPNFDINLSEGAV